MQKELEEFSEKENVKNVIENNYDLSTNNQFSIENTLGILKKDI